MFCSKSALSKHSNIEYAKTRHSRSSLLSYLVASILTILVAIFVLTKVVAAAPSFLNLEQGDINRSFNLLDAGMKGVFNIGPAQGTEGRSFDETIEKNVLKFDYSMPKGSVIGVWTQRFPPELGSDAVDAVRIGVRVPNPEQLQQVFVKVEIKGEKAVQTIPLYLELGWNSIRESINWNTIGNLKEAVFVVSPIGGGESVEGTLYFDIDFYKLTSLQKNFIFVKISLVFVMSLCLALMSAFLGRLFGRSKSGDSSSFAEASPLAVASEDRSEVPTLSRFKRDFFYGIVAVLIAGVAFWIYSRGSLNSLEVGFSFTFLAVGLMGAVIAEVLKFGLTGKHLTPREVFQNILITGFIAAGASRLGVLHAPSNWTQLFMLNKVIATLVFLVYHISNAISLASSGKHTKAFTGALIIGTPCLLNWLMLL